MKARFVTALTLGLCGLAIIVPITASLYMAERQSMDEASSRAMLLADEVLYRSEAASEQAFMLDDRLGNTGDVLAADCTDAKRAQMREVSIGLSYLEAVGYVAGNRVVCSALGPQGDGVDLGPPDFVSAKGSSIRLAVKIGANPPVAVMEKHGVATAVHPGALIDLSRTDTALPVGAYSHSQHKLWAHRGFFDAAWISRLGEASSVTFFDGQYLVAIKTADKVDIAAYAAIPRSQLNARLHTLMLILLPIGLVLGTALAMAILFLARQLGSLRTGLLNALKRKEFTLRYQPIVDLSSGRMVGAEVLLDWPANDDLGMHPDLFIEAADKHGLSERFTDYVLNQLAVDGPRFFGRYPECYLSINLTAADLLSGRVIMPLQRLLRTHGIPAKSILVEVTEHSFVDPDSANQTIATIRGMGVRVAIDDFGTGYSSLSHLTNLQADYLKIDKVFVDAIGTQSVTSDVILHIIDMAMVLNLTVISEGVEKEDQIEFLRKNGVRFAQGWFFSKAVPLDELFRHGELEADNAG